MNVESRSKQGQIKIFLSTEPQVSDPSTNSFQSDPPPPLQPLRITFDRQTKRLELFLRGCPSMTQTNLSQKTRCRKSNSFFLHIMSTTKDDDPHLSPTTPGDDEDAPAAEIEPAPGLNGVPVRCA